jgi:hypothetical protein
MSLSLWGGCGGDFSGRRAAWSAAVELFQSAYEEEAAGAPSATDGSPRPDVLQANRPRRNDHDGSERRRLLESAERHVIVKKIRAEIEAGFSRPLGAGIVENTAEHGGELLGAAALACGAVVAAMCPVAAARTLAPAEPLSAPSHGCSSAGWGGAEQPGAAHRGCGLERGELGVGSGGDDEASGGGDGSTFLADLVRKIGVLAQLAKVRGVPACCLLALVRSPHYRGCKCGRRVEGAAEAGVGGLVSCCSSGVRNWMLEQLRGLEREGQSGRQELRAGLLQAVQAVHLEIDGLG